MLSILDALIHTVAKNHFLNTLLRNPMCSTLLKVVADPYHLLTASMPYGRLFPLPVLLCGHATANSSHFICAYYECKLFIARILIVCELMSRNSECSSRTKSIALSTFSSSQIQGFRCFSGFNLS